MKKPYLLLLLIAFSIVAKAQLSFNNQNLITAPYGCDSYDPTGTPVTAGPFEAGTTVLLGGETHATYNGCPPLPSASASVAVMYYRIYPTGSPSGAFSSMNLSQQNGLPMVTTDGWWQLSTSSSPTISSVDLLAGLGAGNYTIEHYFEVSTSCGISSDGTSSAPYTNTFQVLPGGTPPSITYPNNNATVCGAGSITPTLVGPSGGTYSADALVVIDPTTGTITPKPDFTDVGTFTINYHYETAYGCPVDLAVDVTITDCSLYALPIKLLSFTAINTGGAAQLSWATATEANNKGFEVQYSKNGKDWTAVAFVNSKALGGSNSLGFNYAFKEAPLSMGSNYYRLKQIDNSGIFEFSKVVSLSSDYKNRISLGPNPTSGIVYLNGEREGQQKTFLVFDACAKQVMKVSTFSNALDLGNLPNGVYAVQTINTNGVISINKIIVNH